MRVEYNQETNTLSIGDYYVNYYHNSGKLEHWSNQVMSANNVPHVNGRIARYKAFTEYFGCTPSKMYKVFKSMMWVHYVVPYLEYLTKIGFAKGRVNIRILGLIKQNKTLLDQAKADNQWNIMPLICATGKTPKELRETYKSSWKHLANNSLSRNILIANSSPVLFTAWEDVPTTLIKRLSEYDALKGIASHIRDNFKGNWNNRNNWKDAYRTALETEYMSVKLNKEFKPQWSIRKMKEKHDEYTKEINARKYSPERYVRLPLDLPNNIKSDNYVCTLIESPFELANEGISMGHCVSSYTHGIGQGNYLVYSVKDNEGNRCSTLGITVNGGKDSARYLPDQHYGKYNAAIMDNEQKELCLTVIKMLNERKYK